MDKISPIGDLKYPIGDIIPNWIFSSVSPLLRMEQGEMETGRRIWRKGGWVEMIAGGRTDNGRGGRIYCSKEQREAGGRREDRQW